MDRRRFLTHLAAWPTGLGLAGPHKAEAHMPTLTVGPGMRLDEVRRRSSQVLSFQGLRDDSPLIVETPVTLDLVADGRILAMGPTLLVWVNQLAGVVVELSFAPQDEALSLPAAQTLARALAGRLAEAGWAPAAGGPARTPALIDLQRQFQAHRADDGPFRRVLGQWQLGSLALQVLLKQLEAPAGITGTQAPPPVFLVELTVGDEALEAVQRSRVRQRRVAARLPDGDKLPLSAWIPEPRSGS